MPVAHPETIEQARQRAAEVATRFGVKCLSRTELVDLEADRERNLFLLDVRSPAEYFDGHIPGSRSAPGGQLIQATDTYVGVRGARVVLCDDTNVRAIMTASWLIQMGWRDVWVLEGAMDDMRLESGPEHIPVLGLEGLEVDMVSAHELGRLLSDRRATVVDLSASPQFLAGHIAGARHCVRSRLPQLLATLGVNGRLVLTSDDGVLARLAARDLKVAEDVEAFALMGGNRAWQEAGKTLEIGGEGMDSDPDDVWLKPYEDTRDIEQAMRDYLSWELDLVGQIERDGTADFRPWD